MPDKIHIRVDNRLLHGQVVQFWIPYLEVDHLIIADDITTANAAMTAVCKMAVPKHVKLSVLPVKELKKTLEDSTDTTLMVLLRDISDVITAQTTGCEFSRIVIGNVHAGEGRNRVTDSVYLSPEEIAALLQLGEDGCVIEIKTFPGEVLKMELVGDGGVKWSRR